MVNARSLGTVHTHIHTELTNEKTLVSISCLNTIGKDGKTRFRN